MQKLKLFVIVFLSSLFLICFPITNSYAQDSSFPAQIMEVTRVANTKDRLWERIVLFFKFSPNDKANFQQYLVEKRFGEVKFVMENEMGNLEEISSRYSTYLGNLTDTVVKNKMINKKQELLSMLESHSKVLDDLIKEEKVDSGYWLLLKHDIDYVKIYSDQIKNLN